MSPRPHVLGFILLFMALNSCSSFQKMIIRSQSGIFESSSTAMFYENDLDWFAETTPANMKLMETFYWSDPGNIRLLKTLTKAYSGYGYAVLETKALEEEWSQAGTEFHRQKASSFYIRAMEYGWTYLDDIGIKKSEFLAMSEEDAQKKLSKCVDEDEIETVFFFAQAWGSLINLNKKDIVLVSELPKVKILFDFVCKEDPTILNGACDLFMAQFEGSRPKMLGGNPEKGKALFESFLKAHPNHLLAKANYAQVVLLPGNDLEGFNQLVKDIPVNEYIMPSKRADPSNIFNSIGLRRLNLIKKYQNKLF